MCTWSLRGLSCKIAMWQDVNSTVQQIATPAIEASFQEEHHAVSTETWIPFLDSKLGRNNTAITHQAAKPWTCYESASDQSALLLPRLFHATQIKPNQSIITVRRTPDLEFGHTRISGGEISADFDAFPRWSTDPQEIQIGAQLMRG